MSDKTTALNVLVQVNDETEISVNRVPSADTDFTSLKIGPQTSVLLFNTSQVKKLIDVAMEALRILRTIEGEVEDAELARSMNEPDDYDDYDYRYENDYEYEDCTIDSPCSMCQSPY